MRLECLSVLALLSLVTTVHAQSASFQLRIRTASTFDADTGMILEEGTSDPLTLAPADGRVSHAFYAQAILLNAPDAENDLIAFDGTLQDGEVNSFSPGALLNTEALGFPVPGEDFQSRAGLFPAYRFRHANDDPANGRLLNDGWRFDPLNADPGVCDRGMQCGQWHNIYKFEWGSTDLTPRTVTLSFTGENAAWDSAADGFQTMLPMTPATFEIRIVPAPGTLAPCVIAGSLIASRRRREGC